MELTVRIGHKTDLRLNLAVIGRNRRMELTPLPVSENVFAGSKEILPINIAGNYSHAIAREVITGQIAGKVCFCNPTDRVKIAYGWHSERVARPQETAGNVVGVDL